MNEVKPNRERFMDQIDKARGLRPVELVLRGAKYLDVFSGVWASGDIAIDGGVILGVGEAYQGQQTISLKGRWVVPGFIDSHVHIESTMMTPDGFQKAVLPRGTTSALVDPHEIANVLGLEGMEYILKCAELSLMDFFVMASSCVPATSDFETAGARLSAQDLVSLKKHPRIWGLAEMMNYPGVLFKDPEVLEKLQAYRDRPIDGHCPGLKGRDLNAYILAGPRSCHESVTRAEAAEKLRKGMQVLVREGSVAKNLKEMLPLFRDFTGPHLSLCTDDRNPLDIEDEGHLDFMLRQAIRKGVKPELAFKVASWSTAKAYGIPNKGALAPGYDADLVVLRDPRTVQVDRVLKKGIWIRKEKDVPPIVIAPPKGNSVRFIEPSVEDFEIREAAGVFRIIEVIPNQIITREASAQMVPVNGCLLPDLKKDILKIAVLERHGHDEPLAKGWVHGFGMKKGALGSSVGHDSHNCVSVGTNDADMAATFRWLKENGGGFVVISGGKIRAECPLPVAGLMTEEPLATVAKRLRALRKAYTQLGGTLAEPFLQLAFLCLPVIPELKITNKGLIDVTRFQKVGLRVEEKRS